ncbi:hypothetical protein BDM02DRAFT_3131979 [Thelephora ganbajun]|uniref:Uncharacterized protein n=1 Tax=Thelephora ganbajun TaxID=370292 RepID=A0ACB6Z3F7_THEGA|nr:hypothetical protein BDM02DRAFT_3131979 [Thelephora ganbajun]
MEFVLDNPSELSWSGLVLEHLQGVYEDATPTVVREDEGLQIPLHDDRNKFRIPLYLKFEGLVRVMDVQLRTCGTVSVMCKEGTELRAEFTTNDGERRSNSRHLGKVLFDDGGSQTTNKSDDVERQTVLFRGTSLRKIDKLRAADHSPQDIRIFRSELEKGLRGKYSRYSTTTEPAVKFKTRSRSHPETRFYVIQNNKLLRIFEAQAQVWVGFVNASE